MFRSEPSEARSVRRPHAPHQRDRVALRDDVFAHAVVERDAAVLEVDVLDARGEFVDARFEALGDGGELLRREARHVLRDLVQLGVGVYTRSIDSANPALPNNRRGSPSDDAPGSIRTAEQATVLRRISPFRRARCRSMQLYAALCSSRAASH